PVPNRARSRPRSSRLTPPTTPRCWVENRRYTKAPTIAGTRALPSTYIRIASRYAGSMPRVSAGHLSARRERILAGARDCFGRFGYEGATVRRLEEATGLSRGAIFHHFQDKDSLFLALARLDARRMAQVVEEHGLVQVMRDVLADATSGGPEDVDGAGAAHASGINWLGT